jgi:DNA-binding transcriptional LysR family regulator
MVASWMEALPPEDKLDFGPRVRHSEIPQSARAKVHREGLRTEARMTDWDDLRFFLAVARAGSISGAARALGVNHATVSRRIRAMERRAAVRLFERSPDGWTPTEAGLEMQKAALRVEAEIQTIDRQVTGRDEQLVGLLRVAVSDVATRTLMPAFRAFGERHPGIELELVVSNGLSDLARREADVALRTSVAPPSENLVGRRLARVASSLYASIELLERCGHATEPAAYPWIGLGGNMAGSPQAQWLEQNAPGARIAMRLETLLVAHNAVRGGLGAAILPCVLGDDDPDLRRIVPDLLVPAGEIWVLTHPDLRATARVRAFVDFVRDSIVARRELIEGRRPQPPLSRASGASPRLRSRAS